MDGAALPIIPKKSKVYLITKRLFDIFCSFIGLVILLPLFIIIILIQIITSGFPVFYVAERIGKNGKPFKMFKFRTMVRNADKMTEDLNHLNESSGPTFKIKEDPRVTKFGKFLRVSSIDELPQLLNILIGQMSLVGPRPPLRKEVEQYDEYAKLRLTVTPGLTCTWQCSGRNNIPFEVWMRMDVEYIQKRNVLLDLKIIFKTIPAVIRHKGAS